MKKTAPHRFVLRPPVDFSKDGRYRFDIVVIGRMQMKDRKDPALRVVFEPKHTNKHGTIFGGVILSHIDLAAAVEARKAGNFKYVTVAMDKVVFKEPVYVGDVVSFYTETAKTGRTSVAVDVRVEASRYEDPASPVKVTEARVVFVAVDSRGRPTPLDG